jgi:hypothetical protein
MNLNSYALEVPIWNLKIVIPRFSEIYLQKGCRGKGLENQGEAVGELHRNAAAMTDSPSLAGREAGAGGC